MSDNNEINNLIKQQLSSSYEPEPTKDLENEVKPSEIVEENKPEEKQEPELTIIKLGGKETLEKLFIENEEVKKLIQDELNLANISKEQIKKEIIEEFKDEFSTEEKEKIRKIINKFEEEPTVSPQTEYIRFTSQLHDENIDTQQVNNPILLQEPEQINHVDTQIIQNTIEDPSIPEVIILPSNENTSNVQPIFEYNKPVVNESYELNSEPIFEAITYEEKNDVNNEEIVDIPLLPEVEYISSKKEHEILLLETNEEIKEHDINNDAQVEPELNSNETINKEEEILEKPESLEQIEQPEELREEVILLDRIVQPIRIIEKEVVLVTEDEAAKELITDIEQVQPYTVEEIKQEEANVTQLETPKKLYRRLNQQTQEEKIVSLNETNLPEKGELIYYPDVDYAIEMIDIYKTFDNGKILANNGINLRVRRNNVHAIIGENGAGKSVLMSILFGIYNADSGTIRVNGEEVMFSSAKDAALKGIGMVHQHFKLVENDTVFENVILGLEESNKLGFLKNIEARKKLEDIINRYNFKIDIDKKISDLNVAEQQKTEIIKLLYRGADILIFDEPTAVLSESEIKQFLEIVKYLKADGKTIILITHKFNEIKEVADRATIIRLGTFISEFDINEKTEEQIIAEMVGNSLELNSSQNQGSYNPEEVFEVRNLVLDEKINPTPINIKIHSGEIFAIAGVTGNGQSELALTIAGLQKNKTGEILVKNTNISRMNVSERYKNGLAYVPEDRHKYSIILDMPIYLNTVIDKIDQKPYSKSGFINMSNIKEYTRLFIRKNDIRGTSRGTSPIRNLSGGNQQKLVIARELDRNYEILVLEQPTRGLDVAAINKIHKEILEEKAKGKAILLISYELDEIMSIADTVAVMNKYQIVETKNINEISRDMIGKLMVGENA